MFTTVVIFLSLVFVNHGSNTPIIGILSQETFIVSNWFPTEHHDSFIVASYVKYIESAGGRVVPIWIGQSKVYYERVVNYTNGVLFPGGGTFFNETNGYGTAAKYIYEFAVKANKNGIYYPIWGTCLGMEVLVYADLGVKDIRVNCILKNTAIPLNFTRAYKKSRLFSKAPKSIITSLRTHNVTFNQHRYCLTEKVLKENNILSDWKILSTNLDVHRLEFISTFEHVDYPIYGVQFHPEKNSYEFKKSSVPHSREAVEVTQYFVNFFVDESRKNNNTFPNEKLEKKSLIYNYNPVYTGQLAKSFYEQIYVFNKSHFEAAQLV